MLYLPKFDLLCHSLFGLEMSRQLAQFACAREGDAAYIPFHIGDYMGIGMGKGQNENAGDVTKMLRIHLGYLGVALVMRGVAATIRHVL